jgi:hypothetical protein
MALSLKLGDEQLADLETIRELGPEGLMRVIHAFRGSSSPPLTAKALEDLLTEALPESPGAAQAVYRQLLTLYNLRRQRNLETEAMVDAVTSALQQDAGWSDSQIDQWSQLQPQLRELLGLEQVLTAAKASDLAYEYAYLFQSVRIVTDIRPVFDQTDSAIRAAVISYVLRLYYDSQDGDHSISVAMDSHDVESLLKSCQRALAKARTAERTMAGAGIPAVIAGETQPANRPTIPGG